MRNPLQVLLPAALALGLASDAHADGIQWIADYDVAAAQAAASGKDLLVDFTGSDWCGWCKRLDAEVFDEPAFAEGLSESFVFVALDFPRGEEVKAKVPNPARNDELQELHGIRGFPTVLLMTAAGEVYGRTGYRPGGADKYVAFVKETAASGKAALAKVGVVVAAFEGAEGEAKLAAWDELAGFAETLDGESPFAERVTGPLMAAFEIDADNAQGRKLRALKALFALGRSDDAMLAAARELDPKNEAGLLEQTLPAQFGGVRDEASARAALAALQAFEAVAAFKDAKLQVQLYTNAAMWNAGPLENLEEGKAWARKALALQPEEEQLVAALQEIVDTEG